jgi:hypothetical protein
MHLQMHFYIHTNTTLITPYVNEYMLRGVLVRNTAALINLFT